MSCIPTNSNLLGNRVAVFGISANPPTGKCGHVGIVRYLVQSAEFSEVWILPVYKHMYESKNKSTVTYQQKLELCRLCMEIESTSGCKVRVLELEKEAADYFKQEFGSDYRVGTVDIISYIYKSNSSLKISLVLGTDTFNDLQAGRWKESEKIYASVEVLVIARKGLSDVSGAVVSRSKNSTVKFLHVPWLGPISSTSVRTSVPFLFSFWPLNYFEDSRRALHPQVYNYIRKHRLYGFSQELYASRLQYGVLVATGFTILVVDLWSKIRSR